ncbi:MAG: polyprenyl synthetase family protein [Candidatus Thorarchaeota archaeon]|jgi:geranylgeranyl diphosphate synthase type I
MSERPFESNITKQLEDDAGESQPVKDILDIQELEYRIKLINGAIREQLLDDDGEPPVLYETTRHLIMAGGKRVRSLLLILSSEAVGGSIEDALAYAVATEYIQTASLIHDDIIDDDALRRGVETTHEKYGRKMAIIAGDLLVAKAIKMIGEKSTPEILTYVATGAIRMCEGEAADLLMSTNGRKEVYTKKNYLDIVRMKTVSFMTSAAKVGATIGNAGSQQLEALIEYAENLGYAFQIRDDILDVIASKNGTGKSVLSDLKGSRCNYLLAHALEESTEEKRSRCIKLLDNGELYYALQLIDETHAVEYATLTTQQYIDTAKDAIRNQGFENEENLRLLANFVIKRLY